MSDADRLPDDADADADADDAGDADDVLVLTRLNPSQGENNCHGIMGNSKASTGYGCLMPLLVRHWRRSWAAASDTDPEAPFGLVTLAAGGDEGGNDIGGMRWSQTANFGVMPK